MIQWYVLSLFLYFPEDKSEYIPAAISFMIFFIACIITFRIIVIHSRKEAEKSKELEKRILEQNDQNGTAK
ncbi:hypothetical protein [Bacillus methanolicus]|uniref:Putative membrane protein n=1 Tax=Bacillus methanolicus (strain MGA3 / ATCC 53907) TaxID=796606 RepID=I3DUM2_BACMM|nr:hypothetical protein [Bacillus methanolicus]AIE61177.1 putative membrane protein [Bacillus methanolicus MGA3]EIJ77943.1 hypothetical protein MGA3_16371 [Bacillus methanolicus MGA3]UQD53168.1 hypothetical protein C0971_14910 [Bacillus methanolicus]